MVREIHQEYVKAGAEILETNTFGANRMRLAAFGFAENLQAINQAGVRIAREAARDKLSWPAPWDRWESHIEPLGPTSFAEARAIFREQVEVLVEAGVDLLILETFANLDELREAIFAAREAAGPRDRDRRAGHHRRLSAICRGGMDTEDVHAAAGRMAGGRDRLQLFGRVRRSCSRPSSSMMQYSQQAAQRHAERRACRVAWKAATSISARRNIWRSTRAAFSWAGVKIVGGCCGTTPEHIKVIRGEARSLQPRHREADGHGGRAAGQERKAMAKVPVRAEVAARAQAGRGQIRRLRRNPAAARSGCVQGNRGREALHGRRASTASTCPMARAPARA